MIGGSLGEECEENRGARGNDRPRDDKKREKGDKFRGAAAFVREERSVGLLPIVVRTGINVGKKAREEG